MPTGLYMHSSNRLEELAKLLAEALRSGCGADPLARDVVVVQTPGVARWLSLRLADELGCCMNVEYLFPRNFVDAMCEGMLGSDAPAHPDTLRMGWRIFSLLPVIAERPGAEVLARYLDGDSILKRYQLSRKLADLFDQYLVHRPELIAGWDAGREPDDWQASLWRSLSAAEPIPHLAAVFPRLEDTEPEAGALPERVFIFGLSTLPQLYVNFMQVLGRHVDVELFALAPSEEFWGDLPGKKTTVLAEETGLDSDFGQPLLSSMGAQGKDFSNLLLDAEFNSDGDRFFDTGEATTLARLQGDLLHLNPAHNAAPELADGSIAVASSAGAMREVEALKNHLLALLDADATLRPRDILVLAPDISKYAPCINAVFGSRGGNEPELPYSVADKGVREAPLIDAFLRTLELVVSRKTVRDLLDFLEHPVIAERFGFDDESLAAARRMCAKTGVRWGLDEQDRESLGFGPQVANSWKAGVDSLVLGVMMAGNEENVFAGIAPYSEAEGDGVEIVAKLVAAFDAIREAMRELEEPRSLAGWSPALLKCVASLLPDSSDYVNERTAVMQAIASVGDYAGVAGDDATDVRVIRAALEEMLVDTLSPQGFLSGGITFAELKPMRSVPARVICLLGMDDVAFPRQDRPLSFDRIRQNPRPGDRSVRAGDRYLFLETLLCVRDHLYISYSGIPQHGEQDTPPSVVVTELLEYLEPGAKQSSLVTRHALQPFSPAYFDGGALFSYSTADCDAAKRILAGRAVPLFSTESLAKVADEFLTLDFDSLVEFLFSPGEYFLKNVFGLASPRDEELPPEEEPQKVGGLELYGENVRYVDHLLEGEPVARSLERTKASGILPWGLTGVAEADSIASNARVFSNVVKPYVTGETMSVSGDFEMGEGSDRVRLRARIGPIINGRLVTYRCARMKTKDRLRAWVAAVAIGAFAEEGNESAAAVSGVTTICRGERLDVLLPDAAKDRLADFVSLYREGLLRPLPVFHESSYAAAVISPKARKSPYERALDAWSIPPYGSNLPAERDDPWTRIAWRGLDPLVARREEFMALANRIWSGYSNYATEAKFQS